MSVITTTAMLILIEVYLPKIKPNEKLFIRLFNAACQDTLSGYGGVDQTLPVAIATAYSCRWKAQASLLIAYLPKSGTESMMKILGYWFYVFLLTLVSTNAPDSTADKYRRDSKLNSGRPSGSCLGRLKRGKAVESKDSPSLRWSISVLHCWNPVYTCKIMPTGICRIGIVC